MMAAGADFPCSLWVNNRELEIRKLLGKGKGGYSYLATDGQGDYVLKQIHHEPCDYYQFGDKVQAELGDYRRLKEVGIPIPVLLDVDLERERILKEYIPGETALDLVLSGKMRPGYVAQVEEMCRLLYAAGLNIDYFPTNFILHKERLVYIDFECNSYMEQWDFQHWGIKYWSRTPELEKYLKSLQ